MKAKRFSLISILLAFSFLLISSVSAQELKTMKLPSPQKEGGMPLMQALNERQTIRTFSQEKLPPQVLSNLLWAAWGINRTDISKRTAPSASNMQEIEIYVSMQDGVYLYDAKEHSLISFMSGDIRAGTGTQDFVKDAPVNLVYVADYAKMGKRSEEDKRFYSGIDTGFIAQNVYLYCASEGLGTVVRGLVDRPALEKAMKLRPEQKVVLAQTVGYPSK